MCKLSCYNNTSNRISNRTDIFRLEWSRFFLHFFRFRDLFREFWNIFFLLIKTNPLTRRFPLCFVSSKADAIRSISSNHVEIFHLKFVILFKNSIACLINENLLRLWLLLLFLLFFFYSSIIIFFTRPSLFTSIIFLFFFLIFRVFFTIGLRLILKIAKYWWYLFLLLVIFIILSIFFPFPC